LLELSDLGQSVEVNSIGCVRPLAEIYRKIEWPAPAV
jgi:hypothetical protein